MNDVIPLTPVLFKVFEVLKNAGGELGYKELTEAIDGPKNTLSTHLARLVGFGIINRLGPQKSRTFSLKVDPEKVVLVSKMPRENSEENEPEEAVVMTIRGCITCKESMKSTGAGHRICTECKKKTKYKNYGNRYAPDGEAEVSDFSEITVGYFK